MAKALSTKQRLAARHIAEDVLTIARIAAECDVTEGTVYAWKKLPAFQDAVREYQNELDEQVSRLRFSKRRERIAALDRMARDYEIIIEERAKWFAENEPEVPGGRTGRLVRRDKVIGLGKHSQTVTEYELDKAVDSSLRETLIHIAKERGEWSEKREVTGANGGALLVINEIEVVKPAAPPDDDDED